MNNCEIRSRSSHHVARPKGYERIQVGDAYFTDDPNDDWFGIAFNGVWIGDFCPNAIYINKATGRIKLQESNMFCKLLYGLYVAESLHQYRFEVHHRLILERFVSKCLTSYCKGNSSRISLDNVMITMSQQRV